MSVVEDSNPVSEMSENPGKEEVPLAPVEGSGLMLGGLTAAACHPPQRSHLVKQAVAALEALEMCSETDLTSVRPVEAAYGRLFQMVCNKEEETRIDARTPDPRSKP